MPKKRKPGRKPGQKIKASGNNSVLKMPGSNVSLTLAQEKFCRYYLDETNPETYGHLIKSYIAAGYSNRGKKITVSNNVRDLFKKDYIKIRMNEILEAKGFNSEFIDSQILKVVKQDDDLSNKMKGIQEYNKMKKRVGGGEGGGRGVTVNIINYEDANKYNDPVSVRSEQATVSVTDIGVESEEQGVSDPS